MKFACASVQFLEINNLLKLNLQIINAFKVKKKIGVRTK